MLKVDNINVYYGAIHAIKNVSFQVNEGEIVTLIGANGAGKSTILKTISGLLHTKTGSVSFQDHNLKSAPPHKIVEMGIAHVPEGRRVFSRMSVEENLEMGAFTQPNDSVNAAIEHPLPPSEGARKAGRRHAVRRRAADACHGQSSHVPPQAHDA